MSDCEKCDELALTDSGMCSDCAYERCVEKYRAALAERDEALAKLAEEQEWRERCQSAAEAAILRADEAQEAARELLNRMCLMAAERNPPVRASAFRAAWATRYPFLAKKATE